MPTKRELWRAALEEAAALTDGAGYRMDPGIIETVAALRLHRFSTSQSCEGHLGGGTMYPWVQIYTPAPEGWQEDEEKKTEWTATNLQQRARLQSLLAEFYRERRVPYDVIIFFNPIGVYGGFRLQSIGSPLVRTLPPGEQGKKLHSYQGEMDAFTRFLKLKL